MRTPQSGIKAPNHLRIGEYHPKFGGVLAGLVRGTPGKPDYYLLVAKDAEAVNIKFGPNDVNVAGATSDLDGFANTEALIAHGSDHPAADWAAAVVVDGFSDFYLPARHELRFCYLNVPELFDKYAWYWSSTQHAGFSNYAWGQTFGSGSQSFSYKGYQGRARAVRRLIIE